MARGFRLEPVLDLARRRLEAATGELQKLAQRRADAQSRLDQLQGFLDDYRQQFRTVMQSGLETGRLQDFRAFLTKLERAVDLQGAEVRRSQEAWATKHREWLELRQREQAMGVLKGRRNRTNLPAGGREAIRQVVEVVGN